MVVVASLHAQRRHRMRSTWGAGISLGAFSTGCALPDFDGSLLESLWVETHAPGDDDYRAGLCQRVPAPTHEPAHAIFGWERLLYVIEE